jgi:hypothetical protein
MATIETRVSSNMRRLRKGDMFWEDGELWEVTGQPEIAEDVDSGDWVRVPMIRVYGGLRSRRYLYNGSYRVNLV